MRTMTDFGILVVEDQPIAREGVVRLVESEEGMHVCEGVKDLDEALSVLAFSQPEVAVVGWSPGTGMGSRALRKLCKAHPRLGVVVMSTRCDRACIEMTSDIGVLGFVSKCESCEVLLQAIREVAEGRRFLSDRARQQLEGDACGGPCVATTPLTDRQFEVLNFIGRGFRSSEIGDLLHLSVKTVEAHREHIQNKLNLQNSRDLVRHAIHWVHSQ